MTCRAAVAVVFLLAVGLASNVGAQDVSEDDLARASNDRTVTIGSPATGAVEEIPLEVYVARVLAGEGEPRANAAAHEALAVAIRTYAAANATRHHHEGYDLCDETHCQVPRASTPASRRSTMATIGAVLLFEGEPAALFYSASCGGQSEEAGDIWPGVSYPYLRASTDDVHDGDEAWTVELSFEDMDAALRRAGFGSGRLRAVRIEERTASGRVGRVRLDGLRPGVASGNQFRLAVGPTRLRSTAFTMEPIDGGVRFRGSGYGHGVGMCVIGAGRRAERGETYQQILGQYYPGLVLDQPGARQVTLVPPGAPAAVAVAALPVAPRILVPERSAVTADTITDMLDRARPLLASALGTSQGGTLSVRLHGSLNDFNQATGQPWWMGAVAVGTAIDLAPSAVLEQRGGVELVLRAAVADLLIADVLANRPAWVRIGAARYFARTTLAELPLPRASDECPTDAELELAISAAALRDAESRAEVCFAAAYAREGDWRVID